MSGQCRLLAIMRALKRYALGVDGSISLGRQVLSNHGCSGPWRRRITFQPLPGPSLDPVALLTGRGASGRSEVDRGVGVDLHAGLLAADAGVRVVRLQHRPRRFAASTGSGCRRAPATRSSWPGCRGVHKPRVFIPAILLAQVARPIPWTATLEANREEHDRDVTPSAPVNRDKRVSRRRSHSPPAGPAARRSHRRRRVGVCRHRQLPVARDVRNRVDQHFSRRLRSAAAGGRCDRLPGSEANGEGRSG